MSKLPYDLDEHIDHIDAALFSGDTFTTRENIDTLGKMMDRWRSQLLINMKMVLEREYFEACIQDCPAGCDGCSFLVNDLCSCDDFNECKQVIGDE